MKNPINRRNFFKFGLGTVGALGATKALAQLCGIDTGEQPLGPFFPNPGTPADPIREDDNPQTPIYLANDNDLTKVKGRRGTAQGQVVYVLGQVKDSECKPIANASLIIWQASHSGRYNHIRDADNTDFKDPRNGNNIERTLDRSFQYWGKATTDALGHYQFKTIVPGFYPADLQGGWYRPPHIHFMISAMGFPQLVTQMYFTGEKINDRDWVEELNKKDFLLQSDKITKEQRKSLVVEFKEDTTGQFTDGLVGIFDIVLHR